MNKLAIILGSALFISLAGNLFMAGIMLGDKARGGNTVAAPADRKEEWKKRDAELRKQLSDTDRKVFEDIKAAHQDKITSMKAALEAARERTNAASHADPFSREALEEAMRAETVAKAEFLSTIREMRKEIAGKLSPEGRAAMEKLRPKRDGRKGDRPRREFLDKWRERRGERPVMRPKDEPFEHDGLPMKAGERPDFPPEKEEMGRETPSHIALPPAPPLEDGPAGYGNPPPPPPDGKDCDGCEVPEKPGFDEGLVPPDGSPQP